jgi:hypothetical protein
VISDATAITLAAPEGDGGSASRPATSAVVEASAIRVELSGKVGGAESESDAESEVDAGADAGAGGDADKDAAKSAAKPVAKAAAKPVVKGAAKLAARSAAKPVVKLGAKPVVLRGSGIALGPVSESGVALGPVPELGVAPASVTLSGLGVAPATSTMPVPWPEAPPPLPWSEFPPVSPNGAPSPSGLAGVEIRVLVDPPVPEDLDPLDHDGMTVAAASRRRSGSAKGASTGLRGVDDAKPAARIIMCTGMVVSLGRPVLIGRAPQVSRVTGKDLPRLVTVVSPNHDISRTHAQVRQDGDDVVVTDLHSTNGVLLRPEDGEPRPLHPGDPTVVPPGVVVDLGDGVTFMVGRDD